MNRLRLLLLGLLPLTGIAAASETLADLASVPPDLIVPAMTSGEPAPGRRVRLTTAGWQKTAVHHALYLPTEWRPGGRFPLIVEYAGNGGYRNSYGDVSHGTVEGSNLGYGLTGGAGAIWVCLPFVEKVGEEKRNATKWWGDVPETVNYCQATVRELCEKWGADPKRMIIAGFSRGAIACNFIGLHDDAIASLWRGVFCHSHYDGAIEGWGYVGADRASALNRLKRLGDRPQWISHEGSVQPTENYLRRTGVAVDVKYCALPFRNHSDQWVLRDIPARREARAWLERVLAKETAQP